MANVLKVPPSFFFDGTSALTSKASDAKSSSVVAAFMSRKEGLALAKAYMAIKKLLRCGAAWSSWSCRWLGSERGCRAGDCAAESLRHA